MKHEKLMKTARVLDKVARIASGFMGAFAIVLIIFAVLVLIFGGKMFVSGSITLELGYVKLYLAEEYQSVTSGMRAFVILALTAGSVLCAVARMLIFRVRRILAPMMEGRPFEANIPSDLRRIGMYWVVTGLLVQIVLLAEKICFVNAFPLERIFSMAAVTKIEYVQVIELDFLWGFVIILFLSYIFQYGQMLQQEADETL